MNKWKVTFLHEGNEYGMMVETQYAKDANDLAKVMVKAIDGIDINPTEEPTKWIESEQKKLSDNSKPSPLSLSLRSGQT